MTDEQAFREIVKDFRDHIKSEKYVKRWTGNPCIKYYLVMLWLNNLIVRPTVDYFDLESKLRPLDLNKTPYSHQSQALIDVVNKSPLRMLLEHSKSDNTIVFRSDLDRNLYHKIVAYARSLDIGHAD